VKRALLVVICACGSRPPPGSPTRSAPASSDRIAILASERGPQGVRLVAIDEHGDRRFVAVQPPQDKVRDTHPAISPDGAWVVFASSRDRPLDETSLWIAPLGVAATPVRLTDGPAIDAHPTWMPDGSAIVFASTREGGDFDLWRQPVANGRAVGPAEQLTHAPSHEITPTIAADGAIIYAALTPTGGHEVESHLEQRAADGTITRLTAGPADTSPALSPDGKTLAFARPFERVTKAGTALDTELWRVPRGGELATQLVDLPLTDESGPVWSRDGRFVFATSVLRTPEAGVVFSSVIYVDLREATPRARLLEDHAGAIVRLTPAIAASALDVAALHGNPDYLPELARILDEGIARAQEEAVPSKP